jgi:hypothetical protein
MMRIFFFVTLLCCAPLWAQQNPSSPEAVRRQELDRYRLQQLESWQIEDSKLADEIAKRREAQLREWQFLNLAQRFMVRWKDLAEDYKRGTVNPKKFKAVSKAFRDLEKSEGWLSSK